MSKTFDASNYINYSDRAQISDLDRNIWKKEYSATVSDGSSGNRMYSSEPRNPSRYYNQEGRDPDTRYIIGIDRNDHPDHSSKFGRAAGYYGYAAGHWPGKYHESTLCSAHDPQPQNMAPARFYTDKLGSPCGY